MSNITHIDMIRRHRLQQLERGKVLPRLHNADEVAAYERGMNARRAVMSACVTAFAVVVAIWVAPSIATPPAVKSAALEVGR